MSMEPTLQNIQQQIQNIQKQIQDIQNSYTDSVLKWRQSKELSTNELNDEQHEELFEQFLKQHEEIQEKYEEIKEKTNKLTLENKKFNPKVQKTMLAIDGEMKKTKHLINHVELFKEIDSIKSIISKNKGKDSAEILTTYEKFFDRAKELNSGPPSFFGKLKNVIDREIKNITENYNLSNGQTGRWLTQEEIEKAKSYFEENPGIVKWSRKDSGLPCSVIKGEDGKLYAIARSNKVYDGIKGLLGKGKYGKVKLMQCLDDKTIVVAKIQTSQTFNKDAKEITDNEAQMLQKTGNLLGQAQTLTRLSENKNYIFSTLFKGNSLTDYLKDNPRLSYNEKLSILLKVLEATKNLHAQGIIHGDLSFNNILYDSENDKVNIIDFGFAQKFDASNKEALVDWPITIADDPTSYYPDEMVTKNILSTGKIGYKSDVYILGKCIEFFNNPPFNNPPDEKIQLLTKKMTEHDINKRCSLDDCIEHINKILAEQTPRGTNVIHSSGRP